MRAICLNFQVHQPVRLKKYRFFQIGSDYHYYDDFQNKYLMNRIAERCYLPMNNLLLDLINTHGDKFRLSFSISGTALDQFAQYQPDVLESFKKLAKTGNVEFLAETYYHSLSSLASSKEFKAQVTEHSKAIKKHLGYSPITFRNTEMIFSDNIAEMVDDLGFDTILTEGAKHILGWKSPNFLYCQSSNPRMKLLLRNFKLSDDIAFRFSNKNWNEWPLTAEKFVSWLNALPKNEEIVNLFMDYETFGEHQQKETGIFDFMKALPSAVFENSKYTFTTPGEASEILQPVSGITADHPISWADEERDITAWLGNDMQKNAFEKIYRLEEAVLRNQNPSLLKVWRNLQTSDHLYYMSTKWFSDGDVHKYFNPHPSPYEAYINYMNVLSDFILRTQDEETVTDASPILSLHFNTPKTMKKSTPEKRKLGRPSKATISVKKAQASGTRKPTRTKQVVAKFDEIINIADHELRNYLRTLELDILFAALQNADDFVKDKILSNITKRALLKYEILINTEPEKYSLRQITAARKQLILPFTNRSTK